MKKRLLFVNESLGLAGGEKSLIALLNNIDSSLYEVDLQLFAYGGLLEQFVPSYVNMLPPIPYTCFAKQSWFQNLTNIFFKKNLTYFKSKFLYSYKLRKGQYNHPQKSQLYWECVHESIDPSPKEYDVAIAYAQGIPTFYVMDKIRANKKIAWVNVNVKMPGNNKLFQEKYYTKYDNIVAVSEGTYDYLSELFPQFREKVVTIRDILDYKFALEMSTKNAASFDSDTFNILTVARLNKFQKGYDITLEACRILRDKGLNFKWYAIGAGPYKDEMKEFIEKNNLEDVFILLGTTSNPYPYYVAADLYVQTSRHEGFGLSIAEARLLNTPVVTTNFDTVLMQMVNSKNGLIVDMTPEAVAEGIMSLMNDKKLYNEIIEYLKKENKSDLSSISLFYSVVK